jgi:hypothetical protein
VRRGRSRGGKRQTRRPPRGWYLTGHQRCCAAFCVVRAPRPKSRTPGGGGGGDVGTRRCLHTRTAAAASSQVRPLLRGRVLVREGGFCS